MIAENKKILFIVPHRLGRSPGQRFRFEHFLEHLKQSGFEYDYSNIISESDDKVFYSKGKVFQKLLILLKSIFIRIKDAKRANQYDIIFIYREALMLGYTYFERKFSKSKAKVIFDFDDSIWLNDVSAGNQSLKWLKKPSKTADIIKYANLTFAGNKYLSDYAKKHSSNVEVFPTLIDTSYHIKRGFDKKEDKICIGWTGTSTTLKHFETAIPYLVKLHKHFKDKIYFKVIVDVPFEVKELDLVATIWKKDTEIEDLSEIDIGIMPLPDDEWSRGKCGFKGLQYMSMQIPTIMSPVGVNKDIIDHGTNGYLANSEAEWTESLKKLILSEELRDQIGAAGRQTIINNYSIDSHKEVFINHFNNLISN